MICLRRSIQVLYRIGTKTGVDVSDIVKISFKR